MDKKIILSRHIFSILIPICILSFVLFMLHQTLLLQQANTKQLDLAHQLYRQAQDLVSRVQDSSLQSYKEKKPLDIKLAQEESKAFIDTLNQLDNKPNSQAYISYKFNTINKIINQYTNLFKALEQSSNNIDKSRIADKIVAYTQNQRQELNSSLLSIIDNLSNESYHINNKVILLHTISFIIIIICLILLIIYFMYKTWYFDKIINEEYEESLDIIQTIPDGLFLIKKDGTIASQYSKATYAIFGSQDISGKNFLEVMKPFIPHQRKYDSLKIFIDNLFNTNIIENSLIKLNPLNHIKLIINNNPCLLSFNFSRIVKDKKSTYILVSVKEIKSNPKLEKYIQSEQESSNYQLELLNILLHTDGVKINHFVKNTIQHLNKINQSLQLISKSEKRENIVQIINHEINLLKSEAIDLNLLSFIVLAQSLEDLLLQDITQVHISSITIRLDILRQEAYIIDAINKQLHTNSSATKNVNKILSKPTSHLDEFFTYFVQELSKHEKKKVKFEVEGLNNISTKSKEFTTIKDIIIQLIRNAVVYGIESPSNRAEYGKSNEGHLRLKVNKCNKTLTIYIEDDGQGVDYEAIREKAIELQIMSEDKLKNLSNNQLLNLVFEPDFPTQGSQELGQCANLDNVKNNIKQLDGKITIETEEQHFARFIVEIPAKL